MPQQHVQEIISPGLISLSAPPCVVHNCHSHIRKCMWWQWREGQRKEKHSQPLIYFNATIKQKD
jgi:hypothetical protein